MSKNPIPEKAVLSPPSFPSFVPCVIATALLSLALGYWVGVGNSFLSFGKGKRKRRPTVDGAASSSSDFSSEDESEHHTQQQLDFPSEECKLVLVVRTDLGMTKGKAVRFNDQWAAQCSHATLACYKSTLRHHPKMVQRWEAEGQAKVALQVKSEDELLMLQAAALSLSLTAKVIHDAGRTQIAAGSATVLGIGPGPKSLVDQVTGSLKLY